MTLIKSISGIRGTIGGQAGEGLNPLDIVKFTSAYATLIRKTTTNRSNKIVVGRDARISGEMVKNIVCGTLMGMGFDVDRIGINSDYRIGSNYGRCLRWYHFDCQPQSPSMECLKITERKR